MINFMDYMKYLTIDWKRIHNAIQDQEEDCIEFVYQYIQLAMNYRSLGLEPLEPKIEQSNNPFEKIALDFLVNGILIEYSSVAMINYIYSSDLSDYAYFCDILIYLFILVSMDGKASFTLIIKLFSSFMGLDGYKKIKAKFDEEDK